MPRVMPVPRRATRIGDPELQFTAYLIVSLAVPAERVTVPLDSDVAVYAPVESRHCTYPVAMVATSALVFVTCRSVRPLIVDAPLPVGPVAPVAPVGPAGPPLGPVAPVAPVAPLVPLAPVGPVGPVGPAGPPLGPVAPVGPVGPAAPPEQSKNPVMGLYPISHCPHPAVGTITKSKRTARTAVLRDPTIFQVISFLRPSLPVWVLYRPRQQLPY